MDESVAWRHQLASGSNPIPRRNYPWGTELELSNASISSKAGPSDVGSHPKDVSPYGVLDLAGSVTEWTDSPSDLDQPANGLRVARGGSWSDTKTLEELVDFIATENPRPERTRNFGTGMRCVESAHP